MQLIVTDPWFAKKGAIHVDGYRIAGALALVALLMLVASLAFYHTVVVYGARHEWPLVTQLFNLVATREQLSQERYVKENLEAIARRVGDIQARLMVLDAQGARIASLAGMSVNDAAAKAPKGGVFVLADLHSIAGMQGALGTLESGMNRTQDDLSDLELHLFSDRLRRWMLPTALPVTAGEIGSGFGWRVDPVNGQQALHTGLDFSADVGTPIKAAAGGVVVTQEFHPAYGNMVEIEHGNALMTRYAHASRVWVKRGDIVKRGQHIADVGSTGRSTGPHLHFEVWLAGVVQDPQLFLRDTVGGATRKPAHAIARQ